MWREIIIAMDPYSKFFPGTTTDQIITLEMALSIKLPEELKNLLSESNGVRGEYDLRLLWSAEGIVQENLEMRTNVAYLENYMPFENLLFFADAGNGDMFAFSIIQGVIKRPVIFVWDHEDDSRRCIAYSLQSFVERWLSGKLSI